MLPTNTFVLTFNVPTLPKSIKLGYFNRPVGPFIPNLLHCFKCQRFGQNRIGQFNHDNKACVKDVVCVNCNTQESANSVNWENRCIRYEDKKLVEIAAPNVAGKTYAAVAAAPKPITKGVAIITELTWHSDVA